jgi:hypothetical protein
MSKAAEFLAEDLLCLQGCDREEHARRRRGLGGPNMEVLSLDEATQRLTAGGSVADLVPEDNMVPAERFQAIQPDDWQRMFCGYSEPKQSAGENRSAANVQQPVVIDLTLTDDEEGEANSGPRNTRRSPTVAVDSDDDDAPPTRRPRQARRQVDNVQNMKAPPVVSLENSEVEGSVSTAVSYDVDSLLAIPDSLAVARQGLQVCFTPQITMNLQTNLHVRVVLEGGSKQRVMDIPHFRLGNIVGPIDIAVYVLVPHLKDGAQGEVTNFPTQDQLQRFFDKLFFPAIRNHLDADIVQHLPLSFRDAKNRSLAASSEGRAVDSTPFGRVQNLRSHLPAEKLKAVWDDVLMATEQDGYRDFRGVQLFLNAKNLKTQTKASSPRAALENFLTIWEQCCLTNYIHKETTWLDIGKEVIHGGSGGHRPCTALWRRCCLDRRLEAMQRTAEVETGGFRVAKYHWAMHADAGSMTVEPNVKNPLGRAGLAYSQYYNSEKEMFDAAKNYPFDNKHLESLCIDPQTVKMAQNAGGGKPTSRTRLIAAYLKSRDRTLQALEDGSNVSFGARSEHRINLQLLEHLYEVLSNSRNRGLESEVTLVKSTRPWYVIPTRTVNEFRTRNMLRFTLAFERLVAKSPKDYVAFHVSKSLLMMLRCVKLAVSSSLIRDSQALWKTEIPATETLPQRVGMGFEESLKRSRFVWFRPEVMDWARLTFQRDLRRQVMFGDNSFYSKYRVRWESVANISRFYEDVSDHLECAAKYLPTRNDLGNLGAMRVVIMRLARYPLMLYQISVWQELESHLRWTQEQRSDCLAGLVPLTALTLKPLIEEDGLRFAFPQSCNRHRVSPEILADRVWNLDDGKKRGHWETKPFRAMARRIRDELQKLDPDCASFFQQMLPKLWLMYNTLVPLSQNWNWLPKETEGRHRVWNFMSVCEEGILKGKAWKTMFRGIHEAQWKLGNADTFNPRDAVDSDAWPNPDRASEDIFELAQNHELRRYYVRPIDYQKAVSSSALSVSGRYR